MTPQPSPFAHGALFYDDMDDFLDGTVPFLAAGIDAGEPALVAVNSRKVDALRAALPHANGAVQFVDVTELGRNPGRLISSWVDFVRQHADAPRLRGIGEPMWHGRSDEEISECQRHDALLNVAFADQPGFVLLCPYDSTRLDESVLDGALDSHPLLVKDGELTPSTRYVETVTPFAGTLPEPPVPSEQVALAEYRLAEVRRRLAEVAILAGLDRQRIADLVLAVTEAATNSLRHAGGEATLRIWHTAGAFVCEVQDRGWIQDPLAGRLPAPIGATGGRGLWLIHQLCDLVQVRSSAAGNVVRMHMNT